MADNNNINPNDQAPKSIYDLADIQDPIQSTGAAVPTEKPLELTKAPEQLVDNSGTINTPMPTQHKDPIARLSQIAMPQEDPNVINSALDTGNTNYVKAQATDQLIKEKTAELANLGDQQAAQGDSTGLQKTLVGIKKLKSAPVSYDGSVEELAVRNLAMNNTKAEEPIQKGHVLADAASKRLYAKNALLDVAHDWESKGLGGKVAEFAPFLIPFVSQYYQSDILNISKLNSFNPLIGSRVSKELNKIQNLPYDQFVAKVNEVKDKILNSSTPGDVLVGQTLLNRLVDGTSTDSNMENVFSLIDVGTVAAAPLLRGARIGLKAASTFRARSGSIVEAVKEVSGSKAAYEEIAKTMDGAKSAAVDSKDAAIKNASTIKEPFKETDGGISQRLYNKSTAQDNAFHLLDQYGDNPIAMRAKEIIENHRGIDLTPEELKVASQEASTLFAKEFSDQIVPEITQSVSNNGNLVNLLTFGKADGTGWRSEKAAIKYMTDNFNVDANWRVVKDSDNSFRLQVDSEINLDKVLQPIELRHENLAEKFTKNLGIRNPRGVVRESTISSGLEATTTESKLQKLFTETSRDINKSLSSNDIKGISKVLQRQTAEGKWYTESELQDVYAEITGREITDRELKAFQNYKLLDDIDAVVSNLNVRDYMESIGARTFTSNSSVARYQKFVGKPVKSFEDLPTDRVFNLDRNEFETIKSADQFNKFKERGFTVSRSYDNYKVNGEDIFYVTSRNLKEDTLPANLLPYRPGGRRQYVADFLVKQPKVVRTTKAGESKDVLMGFRTVSIDSNMTRAEARALSRDFNKGVDFLEASKKASGEEVARLRKLADEEFSKTRFGSLADVEDLVRNGKLSLTKMQLLRDRQQPLIAKNLFADGNRLDDGIDFMFNSMRRGELKQNAVGSPAELLSPFEAQAKVFGKDATSFSYRQFALNHVNRWAKTFGQYLDGKYVSNMDMLKNGKFATSAPEDIVNTGTLYQDYIKNLARITEKVNRSETRLLESLAFIEDNFPAWAVQKATGVRLGLHNMKPGNFARTTTYMTIFGFYNPVQFLVQSTSVLNAFLYKALTPRLSGLAMKDFQAMTFALSARKFRGVRSAEDISAVGKLLRRGDKEMANGVSQLVKDWDEVGLNIVDFNFALLDTEAAALTKASVAEKASSASRIAGEAKRVGGNLLRQSTTFASTGEVAGRLAAFTIARRQLLESSKYSQFANRVSRMPEALRRQFIKDLRNETDKFSTGQTRATQLGIQSVRHSHPGFVGDAVALMTQFWQFPIKLLSTMLPKAIGGSAAFGAKEKLGIAVIGTLMIGPDNFPGGDVIQEGVYKQMVKSGLYSGTFEEFRKDSAGLVDRVLSSALGVQVDFGSRIGVGSFPTQVAQMMFGNSSNFWTQAAFPSTIKRVFNKIFLADEVASITNGTKPFTITNRARAIFKAMLLETTSTGRAINRVIDAMEGVPVLSSKGAPLFVQSPKSAILNALGIPTAEYTNYFRSKDVLTSLGANDKGAVAALRYAYREYYRALNEHKPNEARDILAAIYSYSQLHLEGNPRRKSQIFQEASKMNVTNDMQQLTQKFKTTIRDINIFGD